jgi:hypothetical protein
MNSRLKFLLCASTLVALCGLGSSIVSSHKAEARRQSVPLVILQTSEQVEGVPFPGALASAPSGDDKKLYILRRDTGGVVARDTERKRDKSLVSSQSSPRALAVGPEGRTYLADESAVHVVDPAGRTLNTFSVPSPSSVAALNDGKVLVASPNSEQLLNVYNSAGILLGRVGKMKRLDAGNAAQNGFLNRGKVVASPSGDIYYVSMFAAAPTVQRFSPQGRLLSEFDISGEAVDLQLRRVREFLSTKDAETVGGYYAITSAAVDSGTGHLWVGMNGASSYGNVSPQSGVVYEYDAGGDKLAEYAFILSPPLSPAGVITGVRDIAVRAPWIYVLTSQDQIYRFNLNERLALNDGRRQANAEGLLQPFTHAFWAPAAAPILPAAAQASCPPEQPFVCTANCPSGSTPTTRDCAAEIKSRLTQGDRIINDSCTLNQATPGGCSGSATSCNTGTGVQVSYNVTLNCNAAPTPTPTQTASCHPGTLLLGWCANGGGDWIYPPDGCGCSGTIEKSPILIDVAGDGFSMTDASSGVNFDLDGVGPAERLSWTAPNSDDAFLVLDRNSNGVIDNGEELFGNLTPPQPFSTKANGFLALAEYDKVENGGNGDGVIDSRDLIFSSLRLWQDVNHNGVSEPSELHTLPELGLKSIDLDYKESRRIDRNGNQFRYRAKVRDARGAQLGRWAWDVFLVPG